jgi:hypothetical protein
MRVSKSSYYHWFKQKDVNKIKTSTLFLKERIKVIFNQSRETFFQSGNIRVGLHNAAKGGGVTTIHINNAGQLFKLRITP